MNKSYAFSDPSYEEFLIHYGIPRMKWHVRRFENYDGTLTSAGKERYSVYWTKGTNLKGKKVDYDNYGLESTSKSGSGSSGKPEASRSILDYQNKDGSLTPEGRRKFGDILTEKEMQILVKNYNSANGTNYRVGDVSFRKNGKLYSAEGKRVDEDTKISKTDTIAAQTKPGLFGEKELSYKEKLQNVRAMSDEDLKRGIERSKLEKAYIEELGIQKSRGEKFIDNLKAEAASAATEVAKQAVKEAGDAFLKKYVLPKLSKSTGISQEELSKGADKLKEAVDKGIQAQQQKAQQQTQQQTQQKPQQGGNQNTTSKPLEQTSNDDLRSMVQKQKNISEEAAKKIPRDELIKILRSSGGSGEKSQQSEQQSGNQNTTSKEGNWTVSKDSQGRVISVEGKLKPSGGNNSKSVENWSRQELKDYIRKARGYKENEQVNLFDDRSTEDLVKIARAIKEEGD